MKTISSIREDAPFVWEQEPHIEGFVLLGIFQSSSVEHNNEHITGLSIRLLSLTTLVVISLLPSMHGTLFFGFLYRRFCAFLFSIIYFRPWFDQANDISDVESRGSSVCIATGYGLDGRPSIPGWGGRLFSSPQRQDRLWGPPKLLSNGYREFFPRG
jgi:hypothetical protein